MGFVSQHVVSHSCRRPALICSIHGRVAAGPGSVRRWRRWPVFLKRFRSLMVHWGSIILLLRSRVESIVAGLLILRTVGTIIGMSLPLILSLGCPVLLSGQVGSTGRSAKLSTRRAPNIRVYRLLETSTDASGRCRRRRIILKLLHW